MENLNIKRVREVPTRNACPLCGYQELLTEGPDQFCLSCDWDTCAEYVERGLMNNLGLAYREHFPVRAGLASQADAEVRGSVFVESVPDALMEQLSERIA